MPNALPGDRPCQRSPIHANAYANSGLVATPARLPPPTAQTQPAQPPLNYHNNIALFVKEFNAPAYKHSYHLRKEFKSFG
jgi:hypothetical protein